MRKTLIVLAALAAWSAGGSPARAGLYNTAEPDPKVQPAVSFAQYRDSLDVLRNIVRPDPESPERKRYLLAALIDPRGRGVTLTPEQRVNLSAYLIRLGKNDEAIELLRPLEGSRQFMVLSNLATANQHVRQYDRATGYLEQALKNWPKEFRGIDASQLQLDHDAEQMQLRLIRLRAREELRPGGATAPIESVDDLFQVRFVGESGQYEAGTIAAAEKAKLPANALAVVEQLLVWMPLDLRLYWLLGELLNANGQIDEAAAVMNELVADRALTAPELRRHSRIVKEAVAAKEAAAKKQREEDEKKLQADEAKKASAKKAENPMIATLTTAGIGALAGMLVMGLIVFQVREIRRRRHPVPAARRG